MHEKNTTHSRLIIPPQRFFFRLGVEYFFYPFKCRPRVVNADTKQKRKWDPEPGSFSPCFRQKCRKMVYILLMLYVIIGGSLTVRSWLTPIIRYYTWEEFRHTNFGAPAVNVTVQSKHWKRHKKCRRCTIQLELFTWSVINLHLTVVRIHIDNFDSTAALRESDLYCISRRDKIHTARVRFRWAHARCLKVAHTRSVESSTVLSNAKCKREGRHVGGININSVKPMVGKTRLWKFCGVPTFRSDRSYHLSARRQIFRSSSCSRSTVNCKLWRPPPRPTANQNKCPKCKNIWKYICSLSSLVFYYLEVKTGPHTLFQYSTSSKLRKINVISDSESCF